MKAKNTHMRISVLIIVILIFSLPVNIMAQTGNVAKDSLKNINQTIYGGHEAALRDAYKRNHLPRILDTVSIDPIFDYKIETQQINADFKLEGIRAATISGDKLDRLYKGFIKLGFGNYITPLAQLSLSNPFSVSPRSKKTSWGIDYRHLSSSGNVKNELGDKVPSGFSDDAAGVYLKKIFKHKALYTDLNYFRNSMHFYGYNTELNPDTLLEKDSISQRFMRFDFNLGIKSTYVDSTHLNYDASLDYDLFFDKMNYMENHVSAKGFLSYFFKKEQLGIDLEFDYYNRTNVDFANNTVFRFEPWVSFFGEKWRVTGGIKMHTNFVNEDIAWHWYPDASLQYNIIDNILIPYATVGGNLEVNNYMKIAGENPFIVPGLSVDSTNHKFIVGGGLRGNLSSNTTYNVGMQFSQIENMYFFVNDPEGIENQFIVVYDDMEQYKFTGELAYKRSSKLNLLLKGNYFIYSLLNDADDEKAWHMPAFDVTLTARYNLKDKILVNADFFVIGKRYAKSYDPAVDIYEHKEIFDFNLGIEYRKSKILSAFINFNNIAAAKYNKWNNYPTQRFNIMVGITYSMFGEKVGG